MRLRAVMVGVIGLLLGVIALASASPAPVAAVGTGSCDPFDTACLRANNLYGVDICATGNTNCLTSYQTLGVPICAPGNAACAATYAGIITNGGTSGLPSGIASGENSGGGAPVPYQTGLFPTSVRPVFTISTPTPVVAPQFVNGTPVVVAPTSVTGRYGIDVCAADDTNCLLTQQSQGVPVCPPDDAACRARLAGIYAPIPTFNPNPSQTPGALMQPSGASRYIVSGSTDATSRSGVIVVQGR